MDLISFNFEGLVNSRIIAGRSSKYFTLHGIIDDVPGIGFHSFRKKYKVYIHQFTGLKSYWIGTEKKFFIREKYE